MPSHDILVQQPEQPAQLILLFHGVGSQADSMRAAAQALAAAFSQALVVCVNAPLKSEFAGGFQWFSVVGITEENRQARVDTAMPLFAERVAYWQQKSGLGPEATALVGFSQGAIMALESIKTTAAPAGRVVAVAGRFATLPQESTYAGSVHLLHGKDDGVIAYEHTVMAAHRLRALGLDFTAEVRPRVQHEMAPELIDTLVERLQTHVSQHLMQEAMRAAASEPPEPR